MKYMGILSIDFRNALVLTVATMAMKWGCAWEFHHAILAALHLLDLTQQYTTRK